MSSASVTDVQKFYEGSGVFLTGGTGFLGKLTIEKILRSCPGVRKVYVLIRPKKGLTVDERKKSLLDTVVFDRLKIESPDSLEKIVFVPGDCSSPRLGLSDSDYHDLTQHVNIVLHLAANVRFDEKLKVAVNVNVKGTMEVINLCRKCIFLKAAVVVTTAFSNCNHQVVEEKFYEPPSMDFEELHALMDKVTERELEILSPKITGPRKISYLFSKAVIEHLVLTHPEDLPVCIVRPSMVSSTLREPVPGYLDNMYGPISVVAGVGSGVLRVNFPEESIVLDLVPADIVVNCIISAAQATSTRSSDGVTIYNIGTSDTNPLTITLMKEVLTRLVHAYPLKRHIWHPFMISAGNFKLYTLLTLLLHVLPGYFIDLALRMKGKPPMLMKIYKKIRIYATIMNKIPYRNFRIICSNTLQLFEKLSSKEKEIFLFDTRQFNWENYLKISGLESRKYLLNETLDDLEEARTHSRRLYVVHTVTKYLLYALAFWISWCLITFCTREVF